ncbi:MAG: TIGR03936 family radical SAM-associated protein [Ruminococcus sp.]|nr:TIGR03936 family radical SAM-associated protein [Ruminococcus sp.]MDE7137560.1 TIGR03936 family radical SAM-associated protein [Ruminococcus sp.]
MIRLRAVFSKKDRAKYISHLDLNRCMLRTFRRSGLPIWYTEGFHSHPYFSFALALSLGYESDCEILDFNLNEEVPPNEVRDRLNAVMPDGMKIISVAEQKLKITAITNAEYSFSLITDSPELLMNNIKSLINQEQILIEKKTKKGIKTVDIKPDMKIISFEVSEKSVDMVMRLPAGTQTNYNPSLFFEALKKSSEMPFETAKIRRTGIFCENNEIFS